MAFAEVQARVSTVRSQLPTDTKDPVIEKFDVDSAPIMTLVMSGDLDTALVAGVRLPVVWAAAAVRPPCCRSAPSSPA